VQISEEELTDGEGLLVWLEDLVRLGLARHVGRVDLLHALDVAREITLEASVDGGVVHGDDVGDKVRLVEGQRHGCFGTHGMADQCGLLQPVLSDKFGHIRCHGSVVVAGIVGRLAMVAEVLGLLEAKSKS